MKRLFLSLLCVLSLGLPLGAATNYKEGSGSADFEEADYERFEILDADLSSKVPLKSGDTNKKVSWTFWFRAESYATTPLRERQLVHKWEWVADVGPKESLAVTLGNAAFNDDLLRLDRPAIDPHVVD